jgi:glycosyltransferase involved in cell wall biosynthesis
VGLDVTQAIKRRGRGIARYIRQVVAARPEDALPADLFIRGHRWFRRSLFDGVAPAAERRWMPNRARLGAKDLALFHSFGNHLPRHAPCPLSFTVHDVRALDEPAGYEGKERLQRNLGRAAGVVCLTEYGRGRLLHHHPELGDRTIAVIPHGVDHSLFRPVNETTQAPVRETLGLGAPYLLQLGSWFPHKNLELSLEAWALSEACRAGIDLAFVGGGAPDAYRQSLEALAQRHGLADRVHWIDHVGGAELPVLISAATCLLQPSRYEGFALPLLEAMACGTPGVVSDSSCLPEVSAGLWPVAGVDDPGGFRAGIDRMALDAPARSVAIDAGLRHAADFTWERSARAHDAFYRALIEQARA